MKWFKHYARSWDDEKLASLVGEGGFLRSCTLRRLLARGRSRGRANGGTSAGLLGLVLPLAVGANL